LTTCGARPTGTARWRRAWHGTWRGERE
jgi:hypothetical protein